MNFRCSSVIHACIRSDDTAAPFDLKFFSLKNPTNPQFISHYVPTSKAGLAVKPHEMFLWVAQNEDNRALLFITTPAITTDPTVPNLLVVDVGLTGAGIAVIPIPFGHFGDGATLWNLANSVRLQSLRSLDRGET